MSAAAASLVAAFGVIGADALWLVPLGDRVAHGHVPTSIPYAVAPTAVWHDVPAAAQLVFWAAYHAFGGDRGLVVLQTAAVAVGIGALARGLGRQSTPGAALLVSLIVAAGALPAVAVTNVSLFSFALFPVLLALLESETAVPSSRIWLAVPLLAVWGNLHGAVLIGWALLACYLILDRARRRALEAGAVLGAGALALFVNPELWDTARYYWSVFHNEAARQGVGLWAPITTSAFDLLSIVAAVLLVTIALRRPHTLRLWEAVAVVGLAAATVPVSRNATWLLCVAAYPAARSLSFRAWRPRSLAVAAGAMTLGVVAALVGGPRDPGARGLARAAARTGKPVLAEPLLGQQVALAGGRVWVDNPLDAFRRPDQRLYVDWFSGEPSGLPAVEHAGLVLVRAQSPAGRLAARDRRLVLLTEQDGAALYRVRGTGHT